MDKIEKIRQEIERRKVQYYEREMKAWDDNGEYGDEDCYFYQGKRKACEGLLCFLDTLSEEPDSKEFTVEFDNYFLPRNREQKGRWGFADIFNLARHFAEWGADHLRDSTKMVDKSLEEEADKYASDSTGFIDMTAYNAFKAGAEWQKQQMFTHHEVNESLEEAVTHQMEDDGNVDDFVRRGIDDIALRYAELGAEWQKEQMLEDIKLAYGKVSVNPFDCSEAFEELLNEVGYETKRH